jgi:hypothetical protein
MRTFWPVFQLASNQVLGGLWRVSWVGVALATAALGRPAGRVMAWTVMLVRGLIWRGMTRRRRMRAGSG